jgi:hypothetical protein
VEDSGRTPGSNAARAYWTFHRCFNAAFAIRRRLAWSVSADGLDAHQLNANHANFTQVHAHSTQVHANFTQMHATSTQVHATST